VLGSAKIRTQESTMARGHVVAVCKQPRSMSGCGMRRDKTSLPLHEQYPRL
jgi:hypothetical protein